MKTLVLLATLSAFLCGASIAQAACTAEEAQQKVMTATTQLQALAAKDSARFQKLMAEHTAKAQEMATVTDLDAICKYYDELIEKTK